MKRSILVITQDENIVAMIVNSFLNSFTTVFLARSSTRAMEMIMHNNFSLIILDIVVQDMEDGMLLQIIRRLSGTPILVLMRKMEIADRIKVLDMGADDCLVWPGNKDELIVRIEVCIRRRVDETVLKPVVNQHIGLVINPCKRTVEIKRQEISLTKREFDILYLLAGNPGMVFSKEQIYAVIWGEQFVKDDSNIMSHIGRLRKKMGEAGKYIQTVWGIGYRFADGEES